MEFDRPTQRFQQWIRCLDDYRVRAEVEAIELELQNLQMYRELLNHALDLKQRSDAWFTSDAWQRWVGVDDPKSIAATSVKGAQNGEGDTSASNDAGTQTDTPPLPPNSLAARLARERLEPRSRSRARHAAHLPRALDHSAQLAETVEATQHPTPDDEPLTTGLPVRVWLDNLEQPNCSDESPDVSPGVPSLELASPARDSEGATRVEERVEADTREPHSAVTGTRRGKLARLKPISHRLLGSA
jgi:hypothetical protein